MSRSVEYDAYIAAIRSNIDRLGDAAEEAGLDAPVPSCPGWTVDDLTRHIGGVQRFWTDLVTSRSTDPPDFSAMRAAPPDGDRFEWVRTGGHEFADVLAATPEDTPIWTFSGHGHRAVLGAAPDARECHPPLRRRTGEG